GERLVSRAAHGKALRGSEPADEPLHPGVGARKPRLPPRGAPRGLESNAAGHRAWFRLLAPGHRMDQGPHEAVGFAGRKGPRRVRDRLLEIYDLMYRHFGSRRWWPADTPYEMAVGAILT